MNDKLFFALALASTIIGVGCLLALLTLFRLFI